MTLHIVKRCCVTMFRTSELAKKPRILFLQASEPGAYPPIINAARSMAGAGWDVKVLGMPSADRRLRFPDIKNVRVLNLKERPDYIVRKSDYLRYCIRAAQLCATFKPRIIYVSDPLGTVPGLVGKSFCKADIIYHEHDSPTESSDLPSLLGRARRRTLEISRCVIFPNQQRADFVRAELQIPFRKLLIVWNTPRRDEVLPFKKEPVSNRCTFYYHGSVVHERLPLPLISAIAALPISAKLQIAGYETPSGEGLIEKLKAQFGCASNGGLVEFLGPLTRNEALIAAGRADIGLAIVPADASDINLRHMTGASNKVFDYMSAGLPVIVSDLPDWRKVFIDPGYAVGIDAHDESNAFKSIRGLAEDLLLRKEMGARAHSQILSSWNFDKFFAPVIEDLERPWSIT